jgi:hypothetical protein
MNRLTPVFILFSTILLFPQNNIPSEWKTKFENSDYTETSRYDATMEFFRKFEDNSEYAKMITFGTSPQGRAINCLIVSKDKTFTPEMAKKDNKPLILIINGIHSGEIEGKDASMILLREILLTKEKESLLDNVNLLVIPILSVDAHERFGKFNRINQNGPLEMGWRTTSQNLNLNRDWMKADAPEMQAMLNLISHWMPDFWVDTHTTDGADFQYSVTYGLEKYKNIYIETKNWLTEKLIPFLEKDVSDNGFLIAPYFEIINNELKNGIEEFPSLPRLSTGYAAVQNRPCLLIETHMLKPYRERVLATKTVLLSVINFINNNPAEILALNKRADQNSIKKFSSGSNYLPVSYKKSDNSIPFLFKGYKYKMVKSPVSDTLKIVYSKDKTDMTIPFFNDIIVADSVKAPKGYFVPKEWARIIEKMKFHGIITEELQDPLSVRVTKYKFKNVKFAVAPYEGRQRVDCDYSSFSDSITIPAGTYFIPIDQRTVRVIINLLEPKSSDSFLRWGFFNAIFERKEYFENYVMEREALKMMKEDPLLKEEFDRKLLMDENFRKDYRARLNFFYEHSPYFDKNFNMYPVMRVE